MEELKLQELIDYHQAFTPAKMKTEDLDLEQLQLILQAEETFKLLLQLINQEVPIKLEEAD